jgi:hypothetical protein
LPTSIANPTNIIPFYYNDVRRAVSIAVSNAAEANVFDYTIPATAQIKTASTKIQSSAWRKIFI